jgi:hypothetical protein
MSDQWKSISPDEASQHPLYGIKGWLAVFAVGTLLGVLKELGGLNGEAYKAGLTLGQLFALEIPLVKFIKFVLAIEVASVSVIYWLLFTKHPQFRPVSTWVLLCTYPLIFIIGINSEVDGVAGLVMGFFTWAISCAVWVTYLQRSERVRVTFEHCVRVGVSQTLTPANEIPRSHVNPAPVGTLVQVPVPSQPARISIASSHAAPMNIPASFDSIDEDTIYTIVADELETGSTDKGLWTRLYAEAGGDEKQTKVLYIKRRVEKLIDAEAARRKQCAIEAAEQNKQMAIEAEKAEQWRRRNAGLADPSLIAAVSSGNWAAVKQMLESGVFPFGANEEGVPLRDLATKNGDKPIVDLLKAYEMQSLGSEVIAAVDKFNAGTNLSIDEVTLLVDAATKYPDFVHMRSGNTGYTLLHWCGRLGLDKSASILLDLGSDPAVLNNDGKRAHQLTRGTALASRLAATATSVP